MNHEPPEFEVIADPAEQGGEFVVAVLGDASVHETAGHAAQHGVREEAAAEGDQHVTVRSADTSVGRAGRAATAKRTQGWR